MRRRKGTRGGGNGGSIVLCLCLGALLAAFMGVLYDRSTSRETERVQRDVDLLSSSIRTILLSNERFFIAQLNDQPDPPQRRQLCEEYIRIHPEIVGIAAKGGDGSIRWVVAKDSTTDAYALLLRGDTTKLTYPERWADIRYTQAYPLGPDYYFRTRFAAGQTGTPPFSLVAIYSATELLKTALQMHPVQNSEVTLFSGVGRAIASTGYSNAPAGTRIQREVGGFGQLLSVDVADSKYNFWTTKIVGLAVAGAILWIVVLVLLLTLQRDVRKLRSAQASLNKSENRFRTIFEGSKDGFRLMDRYGRVVMVNSAYCDLVGKSNDEILREYRQGDENLEARYASNSAFRAQFDAGTLKMPNSQVITRTGGEEVPVEVKHSFLEFDSAEKLLLSVFRDVSEQRKLEADSQQVQKMDALGELAVGIGNNLKNIFGIVMNAAEMIARETAQPRSQYVDMIVAQSNRASELADDLLLFARSKETEQKPVLLDKLVRQVEKVLRLSLPATTRLSVLREDNLSVVKGDVHQLHQALVNLALTGQSRITGDGEITVRVSMADPAVLRKRSAELAGREFVEVKVSDSGRELDEYSRRRVFEPYFSARSTDQSAGLRLSVAYGIVQRHSGFITVESAKGSGTSVAFYLPVVSHESAGTGKPAEEELRGGNECILVVDDEESFRDLYAHGLRSMGYTIYTAKDGADGLDVFNAHEAEIALVVSDLKMPMMNGEELIKRLLAKKPQLKTILATGAIDLKAKADFLGLGIRDILMKPFLFDDLILAVRSVLDGQ